MERNLFAFVLRHSKRDQLLIVPLVFASMAVYYLSLDLPKMIINEPIQGKGFPDPDSTAQYLRIAFKLPELLGGQTICSAQVRRLALRWNTSAHYQATRMFCTCPSACRLSGSRP